MGIAVRSKVTFDNGSTMVLQPSYGGWSVSVEDLRSQAAQRALENEVGSVPLHSVYRRLRVRAVNEQNEVVRGIKPVEVIENGKVIALCIFASKCPHQEIPIHLMKITDISPA